ncbi:MAG: YceI family protein [Candidatus Eisenbacteria bacterium]|nr:YceI family protein [Candidatus Eisenbacteria bacterium]
MRTAIATKPRLTLALAALVAAAGLLAADPSASQAAPQAFTLDRTHSSVGFRVKHLVSIVPGRFTDFAGTLTYDEAQPENSTVEVTIQSSSVTTDTPRRDDDLRNNPGLFDVANYPSILFKSTSVKKTGDTTFDVTGDLTLRGVTKPVVLKAELLGLAPGPDGKPRIGFTATTKINRQDYGMTWNHTLDNGGLLVGNDVWIDLGVEAVAVDTKS